MPRPAKRCTLTSNTRDAGNINLRWQHCDGSMTSAVRCSSWSRKHCSLTGRLARRLYRASCTKEMGDAAWGVSVCSEACTSASAPKHRLAEGLVSLHMRPDPRRQLRLNASTCEPLVSQDDGAEVVSVSDHAAHGLIYSTHRGLRIPAPRTRKIVRHMRTPGRTKKQRTRHCSPESVERPRARFVRQHSSRYSRFNCTLDAPDAACEMRNRAGAACAHLGICLHGKGEACRNGVNHKLPLGKRSKRPCL